MKSKSPLQIAIDKANGQAELARRLTVLKGEPVLQQNIWSWLNRTKRVPAEYVLAIEEATGVSRHELRPDIYPMDGAA